MFTAKGGNAFPHFLMQKEGFLNYIITFAAHLTHTTAQKQKHQEQFSLHQPSFMTATVVKIRCGNMFNFKTMSFMENHVFNQFAAIFAASSLDSLMGSFNNQVGNRGWSSARAAHNTALVGELSRRGIDLSAVSDGQSVSFTHHVKLYDNKIVAID